MTTQDWDYCCGRCDRCPLEAPRMTLTERVKAAGFILGFVAATLLYAPVVLARIWVLGR